MADGVWARMAGSKIRHDGEFGSEMKYEKYEVGYDFYDKATTKVRHIRGIGLSYLEGDGTYTSGTSDIKGYTVGFYDTFVKDDGQYFDFTVKAQCFATEYTYSALSRSQAGSVDAKGLTIGAEYGYKMATDHGWFVEPQVQLTAGWLRQDDFTNPSGVYVDADTVGTVVYRMGTRIGYEGHKATAFARVDWYHDFSGALATHMMYGDDRFDVYDDYGDTWLEYGLGLSWKVAPDMEVHAEATRGSGSSYDKDWAFNMGIQYEF